MTSVFSWQNSLPLICFILYSKAKFACYSRYVLISLILHSSPLWWKGHLFWVLVLEGLVGLHRTVQLQLLLHYSLGHRPGLLWYSMDCLGNEQKSFLHFWDCTQVMVFTLAISCLTTSNLPWFMDLTFQVPMQNFSLQHQILLPSPVISTTGCCFHFGSVSLSPVELFFHSSPVAYWASTNLGS